MLTIPSFQETIDSSRKEIIIYGRFFKTKEELTAIKACTQFNSLDVINWLKSRVFWKCSLSFLKSETQLRRGKHAEIQWLSFQQKTKAILFLGKKVNFAKNNERNGVQNSLLFINNAKSVAVEQASIPAKNLHKS